MIIKVTNQQSECGATIAQMNAKQNVIKSKVVFLGLQRKVFPCVKRLVQRAVKATIKQQACENYC